MASSEIKGAKALGRELSDWRRWLARLIVLGFAALASLAVVCFTWLCNVALRTFGDMREMLWWSPLLWTPTITALIVWVTRRWFAGASGSGIPQVLAALDTRTDPSQRSLFVSLRLSLVKILLTAGTLLAGLSTGREGPSVQVAAGVMHHARRWLPARTTMNPHSLMAAGGAAGVAAAFNTPLGGIMFAIEQLSHRPEDRSSGALITAIVLAGLVAMSVHGNGSYFGRIQAEPLSWSLWWPGLCVAVLCGLVGGLFSRLLVRSLQGGGDRLSALRSAYPVRFAAGCGLAVAVIGIACGGSTFGSGYQSTQDLLQGRSDSGGLGTLMQLVSTWLSLWSGVPGGVFAPALAIGAELGGDIAHWSGLPGSRVLIALGMAGFLAATTQAPITAFFIVMEMLEGQALVLSLMACAMVASTLSRIVSPSMYGELALLQLARQMPPSSAQPSTVSPAVTLAKAQ